MLYLEKISAALPVDSLSNREFCILVPPNAHPEGFSPETADTWIKDRSGIRSRRVMNPLLIGDHQTHIEEELKLTSTALDQLQLSPDQWDSIDGIVTIRSSPKNYTPSLSQRLSAMHAFKNGKAPQRFTLDLFQPSTGLITAMKAIRGLPFQNILVIICEVLTPFLNLNDVGTAMLFGDAAVAAIFSKTKTENTLFKIEGEIFYTTPDFSQVLQYDDGASSFHMKGPELFRKIVPEFKRVSERMLGDLELNHEQIQYYLPHQANLRLIERVAHHLGFEPAQLITNIENVGNTSSASMGVALVDFLKEGVISAGNRILLNACGAGLTSGAAVIQKV